MANVLSVLLSVSDSNYHCGVFQLLVNVLSVFPSVTEYNYPCGLFNLLVNVNRQYIYQKFEDTTGIIRICISRESTDNKFTKSLKIRQA
jgi:peptide methionine sulfoxide reductase MsrB